MRQARYTDKDTVVKILTRSFNDDPHVNWLIEESQTKTSWPLPCTMFLMNHWVGERSISAMIIRQQLCGILKRKSGFHSSLFPGTGHFYGKWAWKPPSGCSKRINWFTMSIQSTKNTASSIYLAYYLRRKGEDWPVASWILNSRKWKEALFWMRRLSES